MFNGVRWCALKCWKMACFWAELEKKWRKFPGIKGQPAGMGENVAIKKKRREEQRIPGAKPHQEDAVSQGKA